MHLTLPLNSWLKLKLTSILQQLVTGASSPVKTQLKQSLAKNVLICDFFLFNYFCLFTLDILTAGHRLMRYIRIVSF